MIVVRNTFQIKFGRMKEAISIWKEGLALVQSTGSGKKATLLTDLTGRAYRLVLESTYENMAELETFTQKLMGTDEWSRWYQKFVPLAESSEREILKIAV